MRAIKAPLDPEGMMNTGKVATTADAWAARLFEPVILESAPYFL